MVELPGNEISIRNKLAQEKVNNSRDAKQKAGRTLSSQQNSSKSSVAEQIVLSSKAKNIQNAKEIAKSSPDIRVDKVNRIKKEIAEGRFEVDSDVLAGKILEDIIKENGIFD